MMMPLTYWHTLRHLRPVQLYGRVWFRLAKPCVDLRPAPSLRPASDQPWVAPALREQTMTGPERFCFLNETHDLSGQRWDDPAIEKLWRYNLHYFDDLNAVDAEVRGDWHSALLTRWVRDNPPGSGTGWEPYPTSLRIVNWIKWAQAGNALPVESVHSLAVQARWLLARLERHLLGNHLFANAKALIFAGLFFDGAEANAWLEEGFRILEREIPEQILSDGGQFERSPMYHALALEDMLDLCNVTAHYAAAIPARWHISPSQWRLRIPAMRHWLAAMCHPDGEICFFNDSAIGIAPPPRELEQYAERLGFPAASKIPAGVTHLESSGYIRVEERTLVAILDVAPVGPDYLPAHAHADTLSFELSLFGQRVIVNSGTSCYGDSAERLRQRGTAAHSTVVVNDEDSSEVWGGFRVARRAKPVGLEVAERPVTLVRCAHDGYTRLAGMPVHAREWVFDGSSVIVQDRISGEFSRAQARFHLHPSVSVEPRPENGIDGQSLLLALPRGQSLRIDADGGVLRAEPATWHREFGMTSRGLCLTVDFNQSVVRTRLSWSAAA